MTGERIYDLEERLINFALMIIDIVEQLPNTRVGNHIAGQLIRCGTSPAANYGEAQSAESGSDFVHKLKVVLKELQETRVWLKIIDRKRLIPDMALVGRALQECKELIAIFAKSIATSRNNRSERRAP